MKSAISKQELLDDMHASAREFVDAVRAFPEGEWSEGRYEEGWTAKDILAHVASIEWTYPRLLAPAEAGPRQRETEKGPRDVVDDYNRRQVDKRKALPVGDLMEEFQRNRAATIAAVEDADESLLDERVRSAGGTEGTAAEVLNFVAVTHVRQHLEDLERPAP
jgi:uncharacterized damage-inducible protein DinB